MLKFSNIESAEPRKGIDWVSGDNRAGHDRSKIVDDKVDDKVDNKTRKKNWNPSKSKNLFKSKKIELDFLTSGARMAFTKLRQVFIKILILYHFDLERYILIEMDISGYAIGRVLSQLISDDLGQ